MSDVSASSSDLELLRTIKDQLEQGLPVALATILDTRGSMPRREGARMGLLADGRFVGTIGGGNIERIAQQRMGKMLEAAQGGDAGNTGNAADLGFSRLEWMTHEKNAMACGGDALLAIRLVTGDDLGVIEDLVGVCEGSKGAWLVEDWRDPERPAWSVRGDGSAKCPAWDEAARRYEEPVAAEPVCYVFGGGHVGQALVPVLASVGFVVHVVDDRPGICEAGLFPQARAVTCCSFKDIDDYVSVGEKDYVVVLTHGHLGDAAVLERVLPRRPFYVGCIGSRRKAAFVIDSLEQAGIDRVDAERVHLPIGEDIGAVTPAEIAVSIAAQLIRCRAGHDAE